MKFKKIISVLCASLVFLSSSQQFTGNLVFASDKTVTASKNNEKSKKLSKKKVFESLFSIAAIPTSLLLIYAYNTRNTGCINRLSANSNVADDPVHRLIRDYVVNDYSSTLRDKLTTTITGNIKRSLKGINGDYSLYFKYRDFNSNEKKEQKIFDCKNGKLDFVLSDDNDFMQMFYFIICCIEWHGEHEESNKYVIDLDSLVQGFYEDNLHLLFSDDAKSREVFIRYCRAFNRLFTSLITQEEFDKQNLSLEGMKKAFGEDENANSELTADDMLSKIQRRQLLYRWVNIGDDGRSIPMYFVDKVPDSYSEFVSMSSYHWQNNPNKKLLNLESDLLTICLFEAPHKKYIHRKKFLNEQGKLMVYDFFECERWAKDNFCMTFEKVYDILCDAIIYGRATYGWSTKVCGCWSFSV